MSDLTEFLRARFDEDEARRRRLSQHPGAPHMGTLTGCLDPDIWTDAQDVTRRLTFEHQARRMLLEAHRLHGSCDTLKILAYAYADDADHRVDWLP